MGVHSLEYHEDQLKGHICQQCAAYMVKVEYKCCIHLPSIFIYRRRRFKNTENIFSSVISCINHGDIMKKFNSANESITQAT